MRILVTAGNTQTPLDRVRCITNIFTGQTGTRIAQAAQRRGHDVHLLTSHPDLAIPITTGQGGSWSVSQFRTFDELHELMEAQIVAGAFHTIIHCAAVSDFRLAGIFAPTAGTSFNHALGRWHGTSGVGELLDVSAGKVKSQHPELWLQLVPTPKLVDLIRTRWAFDGILVKFKLEVGVSERELEAIASSSRRHSDADLIVANTLDEMHDWALLGRRNGLFERLPRPSLAQRLISEIETLAEERCIAGTVSGAFANAGVAAVTGLVL